ncbi:hypothetical protein PF002_g23644 [Phytophthora fragariae]|uniref:Adenylate kinase active site lid domain-containing protein n=1 Tax=Phytophthora fragariae TaxID=53985 RepID=A0A6A3X8C8_9STRA|nr:hypothetical protein PF002_g23644 [Phytophthora fragariae]
MCAEANTTVEAVINFNVPVEVLVERISGRRVHSASGRSYHVKFAPPKVAGKDDMTGEPSSKQFRLRRVRCVTSTGYHESSHDYVIKLNEFTRDR